MDFNQFKEKLDYIKTVRLGGEPVQFTLAPELRLAYSKEKIRANNPKKAAVLALFYPNQNNETCFLLTKRASYKGAHSSQISFPGGKFDQSDQNLQQTALRETFEEVGVSQTEIQIIREITNVYIPPSNFLATPFVAFTPFKPSYSINYEVEKTLEILVSDLLNDQNISTVKMKTSYMDTAKVPCFKLNNHIVWGATAMILAEIKELLN